MQIRVATGQSILYFSPMSISINKTKQGPRHITGPGVWMFNSPNEIIYVKL